jgi:hypothetical protein
MADMSEHYLFDVLTPLGFKVHCTHEYWDRKIIVDHPIMATRVEDVKRTLANPAEIRQSRTDEGVYLFYTPDEKRLVCAVVRQTDDTGSWLRAIPPIRSRKVKRYGQNKDSF